MYRYKYVWFVLYLEHDGGDGGDGDGDDGDGGGEDSYN